MLAVSALPSIMAEVLAYGLVMAAAALRVWGPLAMPQWLPHLLVCAALAWCAAFAIYIVVYKIGRASCRERVSSPV